MFELKLEANKTDLTLGQYNSIITKLDSRTGEINSHIVGSFHPLAIVNSAVVNMSVLSAQVPLFISFRYIPRSVITGSYSNPRLSFLGNHHTGSSMAGPFYIPTSNVQRFQFLHILTYNYYCYFCSSHHRRCEVVSHCDLGFHLLKIQSSFKNQSSRGGDHFILSLKKSEQYVSQQIEISFACPHCP